MSNRKYANRQALIAAQILREQATAHSTDEIDDFFGTDVVPGCTAVSAYLTNRRLDGLDILGSVVVDAWNYDDDLWESPADYRDDYDRPDSYAFD